MEKSPAPQTIDAYIAQFPNDVQKKLQQIRVLIHQEIPEATEKISYQMPTFFLHGNLIHFAAFAHHIGMYPLPDAVEAFKKEFAPYKQGKGSIQFPLDQELPLDLILKIVRFRKATLTPKPSVKGGK